MLTENKAKLLISKAFSMKEQIESLTKEYNKTRSMVYDFLDQNKTKALESNFQNEMGNKQGFIVATRVEKVTSISYDIPKLKARLDKDLFDEIVDKTYTITDIDSLVLLLKKAGVKPSEFKKLISVKEKVNNAKIQQAYSIGDISLKDISDAYEAKVSKSLQLRKVVDND